MKILRCFLIVFLVGAGAKFSVPPGRAETNNAAWRKTVYDSTKSGEEPKVILFLGNSLTAGYGLEKEQAFPALIEEKIRSRGWPFKVINAGMSGDTTAGGLRRLPWLLKARVDVLILELGANDGLRGLPLEVTQKNLRAIIDRTKQKYPKIKIVLAGMKLPPNMGEDYTARFESLFSELAGATGAKRIPFLLKGVGGNAGLNLPDAIHPTAGGHKIVAENVWKVLEPLLNSMR